MMTSLESLSPPHWNPGRALTWLLFATLVEALLIVGLLVERIGRRRAERALAQRLRFERLVAELSARLIPVAVSDVDAEIARGLERAAEFLRMDRASLGEYVAGAPIARISWVAEGCAGAVPVPAAEGFPWTAARLRRGD